MSLVFHFSFFFCYIFLLHVFIYILLLHLISIYHLFNCFLPSCYISTISLLIFIATSFFLRIFTYILFPYTISPPFRLFNCFLPLCYIFTIPLLIYPLLHPSICFHLSRTSYSHSSQTTSYFPIPSPGHFLSLSTLSTSFPLPQTISSDVSRHRSSRRCARHRHTLLNENTCGVANKHRGWLAGCRLTNVLSCCLALK